MKTIGVIGCGTMGSGIAQVAALAGYDVLVFDASTDALGRGMERIAADLQRAVEKKRLDAAEAAVVRRRLHAHRSLNDLATSSFIIEAAAEDLAVKSAIFRTLDRICSPRTILATNTSSLSVTTLGSQTKDPGRLVGMHFFNPPAVMKLVEVVRGAGTTGETIAQTAELARKMGKVPVVCRDTPGFIVNRVARPFYGEALRILGEGIAPVELIDRIVRLEGRFKMGPFELMDLIGIDVNFAVTKSVYERFLHEPRFRPHPIQKAMVESGRLGRKSGKGFYTYE